MLFPALDDTIVAVSSAWEPSPLGIVRLSGPQAFTLAAELGASPPLRRSRRRWTGVRLVLDEDTSVPAWAYWFFGPRSYTGQDVVELHTPGCLPLLRELCRRLIERGARRALPGEFTARAYLNGQLSAAEVDEVAALLSLGHAAEERRSRRAAAETASRLADQVSGRLTELLALVEAGIDFTEEEHVQAITPEELCEEIEALVTRLRVVCREEQPTLRVGLPYVALAGLPNAGKSTLFNALLGEERAIVSPVLGTTRDVLSAEVRLAGTLVVLQDCAGLGRSEDELELAAHLAAERTAEQADVVIWVHSTRAAWSPRETRALEKISFDRRILAWSCVDLASPPPTPPVPFPEVIPVSAIYRTGIDTLAQAVSRRVVTLGAGAGESATLGRLRKVLAILDGLKQELISGGGSGPGDEILALGLREAAVQLAETGHGGLADEVLGRIFSRFCVGK